MPRRGGVQAEVLASLALVMLTATALLAAFLLRTHAAQIERIQGLLGAALLAEASAPAFGIESAPHGLDWWSVEAGGGIRKASPGAGPLDAEGRRLAAEALAARDALLRTGPPWEAIRFAVPVGSGGQVAVARAEPAVSRTALLGLLLADCAVFCALGVYLLRRRVVGPLRRLAAAAEAIAAGEAETRVVVEGVAEAREVGWAFNEMSEALEVRTGALEKAVAELREANRHLRDARAGLDRAERLAAVGSLAAGVAHEVGNPMGALLAFIDLARRDGSLSARSSQHVERAAEQGERVRFILRQLLDFSRPPRARRGPLDLLCAVEQSVSLVKAQRRYAGIDFRIEAEPALPRVLGDESLVGQILLNLVLNAAQALGARDDARVRIRLRSSALRLRAGEGAEAAAARRVPDAVECVIADNGPGVPDSDRERIFDPFFTTKDPGEGTGLGLANAQRLAEELGGLLDCDRCEGLGGAAFSLRLPAQERGSDATPPETRRGEGS